MQPDQIFCYRTLADLQNYKCLGAWYARNPSLKQRLFTYVILEFAIAEAMYLFCLMILYYSLYSIINGNVSKAHGIPVHGDCLKAKIPCFPSP